MTNKQIDIYPMGVYDMHMKYLNDADKARIAKHLRRIEGQVRGLQKLVEEDTYCIDIITQTSAVKQSLSSVEDLLMENHLGHCVRHQMSSGQVEKAKEEVLKVYKLKRK
mgnify:CR=1 FL=1